MIKELLIGRRDKSKGKRRNWSVYRVTEIRSRGNSKMFPSREEEEKRKKREREERCKRSGYSLLSLKRRRTEMDCETEIDTRVVKRERNEDRKGGKGRS